MAKMAHEVFSHCRGWGPDILRLSGRWVRYLHDDATASLYYACRCVLEKKITVLFRQFAYGVAIFLDEMVLVKSGGSIQLCINVVTGEKPRQFSISAMKLGPCGPFLLEKEKSKPQNLTQTAMEVPRVCFPNNFSRMR
jgi:hypothetical protein